MKREVTLKSKCIKDTSAYYFASEDNINYSRVNIYFDDNEFAYLQIMSSVPATHPDYNNKLKDLCFNANDIDLLEKAIAKIKEIQNERRILQ
jgi:hypothetical protein